MKPLSFFRPAALALAAFMWLGGSSYAAAVDYFLKIDGIPGESLEPGHTNELEIESFSWGVSQSIKRSGGGGGGAGKVSFQDLHFRKRIDKSSPLLMKSCATGQHIKEAKLTCRKAGREPSEYYVITLSDILVTSYQVGGSSTEENTIPVDSFSLNYGKIEVEYFFMGAQGQVESIKTGYDLKLNKGI